MFGLIFSEDDTHLTEEERMMKQIMGFGQFSTTKGKKVQADVGEAHVVTKRKYRQYMNRRGGFNRPLDAVE
ncbi:hypothetical protein QYM36_001608 [Artemia franciscana]|uniref:U4/U6.U5 small nuclear ribonucleoprotein 27 kDa protein n=1 Tax=Artemia franciscana TaxID=6661 RepID=A0AA88I9R5_ARTSF|nr:hypothetical protein QYM36_001608 [Artemia franciscana]